MTNFFSRRTWLRLAPVALPWGRGRLAAAPPDKTIASTFPTQPPELIMETVTVAHGNVKRVKELVEARPSLAKASWDWGFGDWESALGAASHVGNREIAEYLLAKGARPSIFSAAMLGQLDVVKAFVTAQPGVQRILGPHSIPLLAHAKAGGAAASEVYRYLDSLGDAAGTPSQPLSDEDVARLSGTYVYGTDPSESIAIGNTGKLFCFTRSGATARPLNRIAGDEFRPAGAEAVRIRFVEEGGQMALQVYDPVLVLTARRMKKAS
jgi:hypothetical protein